MVLRKLSSLKLKNKSVLLRIDINSDMRNGKIVESDRIKEHSKTIKLLLKKKAKVVILAHQGSPGNRKTLEKHYKLMKNYLGKNLKFVDDILGKRAVKAIRNLDHGQALLLENVRFLEEEFKPGKNNRLVMNLAPWFDYYVNDAFSICHRNQTSIVGFPKVLPSAIGPVLQEELENSQKIKSKLKDCLFILGGAKSKDLIPLIKNKTLSTGKLSLLVLMAYGYKLGKDDERMKEDKKLISQIKKNLKHIKGPVDLAINFNGERKEIDIEDLPVNHEIWDIGKDTIKEYKKEIKKAEVIFFKGSPGLFQEKGFGLGTEEILKAIAKSKAFSVIAGGQSSDAIKMFNINRKKFNYVSLSGGALVSYLAGKKLPGLEALK